MCFQGLGCHCSFGEFNPITHACLRATHRQKNLRNLPACAPGRLALPARHSHEAKPMADGLVRRVCGLKLIFKCCGVLKKVGKNDGKNLNICIVFYILFYM